jgi:AraC-like DNA-binding protein
VLNEPLIRRMWAFLHAAADSGSVSEDLGRLSRFLQLFHELELQLSLKGTKPDSGNWLDRGLHFMQVHYTEGITVGQTAEYAGVERTHFTRHFHSRIGVTPIYYLQQLRIGKAKELLAVTEYSHAEIAQTVGYPDLFTFSKAFKRWTGLTPKQYRVQERGAGTTE